MPITPETRDRLTSSVAQLVRTGRHVSARAAAQLYGDLPSFGWALLVPLERRATSAAAPSPPRPASTSRSPAGRSPSSSGSATSSAGPIRRTGGPACSASRPAGTEALAATRALRAEWSLTALADWDEADARQLSDLLDRLVAGPRAAGVPAPAPQPPSR